MLLADARRAHPHAKRALLVGWGDWGDTATGDEISDAIVHGHIDHYVVRPLAPPDEAFHRAPSLAARMSHYLVRQIRATPNVEVRLETEIVGGGDRGWLDHLVVRSRATREEETVPADGLFLMIGADPGGRGFDRDPARPPPAHARRPRALERGARDQRRPGGRLSDRAARQRQPLARRLFSAAAVSAPTTPSGERSFARWNATTAALVRGPKVPSSDPGS